MGPISSTEPLARYIFQSGHYNSSQRRVKYAAFMPAPKNRETSVYRISGLSDIEIWDIGNRFVSTLSGRPLLGRADILTEHVLKNGLRVQSVPEPHQRHANITNWPEEPSKQKSIAIELANRAILCLVNS